MYQPVPLRVPAPDFESNEWLYLPRNVGSHRLYDGVSPVEQIALTINIALRREPATLDYTTESILDSFATLPKDWTVDQSKQFEDYFDALMSGNLARRRTVNFMPAEFKLTETPQPPLKGQYRMAGATPLTLCSPFLLHAPVRALGAIRISM